MLHGSRLYQRYPFSITGSNEEVVGDGAWECGFGLVESCLADGILRVSGVFYLHMRHDY
jgi:hypothetical protein